MKNRVLLSGWLIFIMVSSISFFKLDIWQPNLYRYIFMAGFGLAIWNSILIFMNWRKHTPLTRWSTVLLMFCYVAVFSLIVYLMITGTDSTIYHPAGK